MAIINRLRMVDTLRERLGDDVSREFTEALQDEMAPLMTKNEIQLMIASLLDQLEARMWRVVAIASGVIIGTLIGALAIATSLILTLD